MIELKRILLNIIFVCLILNISAQTSNVEKNAFDDKGKKHGYWESVNAYGKLNYKGQFIHGIPDGEFIYYYPDGKLKAKTIFSENGSKCETKMYHSNGIPMATGKYIDKMKDGKWKYYSREDEALLREESYVNGTKNGNWLTYYPNGQLAEEYAYLNDLIHGKRIHYYTNGQVYMEYEYQHGKKEGEFKSYTMDGKLEQKGNYVNDTKKGKWIHVDKEGNQTETKY